MNNKNTNEQETALRQTGKDLTNSVFIVSVLLNLSVFIAWLIVATNTNYALILINQ